MHMLLKRECEDREEGFAPHSCNDIIEDLVAETGSRPWTTYDWTDDKRESPRMLSKWVRRREKNELHLYRGPAAARLDCCPHDGSFGTPILLTHWIQGLVVGRRLARQFLPVLRRGLLGDDLLEYHACTALPAPLPDTTSNPSRRSLDTPCACHCFYLCPCYPPLSPHSPSACLAQSFS